jgi:alanine racemase
LKLTSSDIAKIVNGSLTGKPDLLISDIITDSRHLGFTEGLAFFAIVGKNHDGHLYINNLYNRGIRTFIVEKLPAAIRNYKGAAFILTKGTVHALQLLAAYKRKSFKSTVIAVTGSAGKTVVKEWLAEILGLTVPVVRSPKSYNSQIGVPLSVWKLDNRYRYGIFEAGISMPGEMEKLQQVIDPDIGVITNIGDAHSENFTGNRAKAKEKLILFKDTSRIIFCSDNDIIRKLIGNDPGLKSKELTDWSFSDPSAAIFIRKNPLSDGRTNIEMRFRGNTFEFVIPFNDRASVENAVTVASVCLVLGVDPEIIRKGLSALVSVAMRMEIKTGINNCQLIVDYYNSDPGSLGMAIEYLAGQNDKKSTLILSDFVQSGRDDKDLYGEVADIVSKAGIDKFIGIGPALSQNSLLFKENSLFYYSTEEFAIRFNASEFRNETILLKGARKFEFERIGKLLEQQVHQTVLEVNLDAIAHNLNEFRRHLEPGTRIMAMVKAFAYGAGPAEIAAFLEYHRVSYLGVAYADEGVELRNAGVTLPVMVMNPDPSSSELMIRYNLEPVIFSFQSLEIFLGVALKHGVIQYPVHIKIDTGMHRLGFMPLEIEELCTRLGTLQSLRVVSVFSHFAASEDPALDKFTRKQAKIFLEASAKVRKATGYAFLRHICNSSAIIRFPQYQFEMVRPGIGLYGVGGSNGINLKPAGRFKTKISQVKTIPAGDPVGYGCVDVSDKERIIAIFPVGYADGLSRKLGNRKGNLLIRNSRVPIIGNICMDMCMADITGINAETGDEAEIFGEHIRIEEVADQCQTIPYEILTSIPSRVKRVFFSEQ